MGLQNITVGTVVRTGHRWDVKAQQMTGLVRGQQMKITAIVPEVVYGRKAYQVITKVGAEPVLVWAGQVQKVPDHDIGPPWKEAKKS
jgi:hypothetical protein